MPVKVDSIRRETSYIILRFGISEGKINVHCTRELLQQTHFV